MTIVKKVRLCPSTFQEVRVFAYLEPTPYPPAPTKRHPWRTLPIDTNTFPQRVSNTPDRGCAKFLHRTTFGAPPFCCRALTAFRRMRYHQQTALRGFNRLLFSFSGPRGRWFKSSHPDSTQTLCRTHLSVPVNGWQCGPKAREKTVYYRISRKGSQPCQSCPHVNPLLVASNELRPTDDINRAVKPW